MLVDFIQAILPILLRKRSQKNLPVLYFSGLSKLDELSSRSLQVQLIWFGKSCQDLTCLAWLFVSQLGLIHPRAYTHLHKSEHWPVYLLSIILYLPSIVVCRVPDILQYQYTVNILWGGHHSMMFYLSLGLRPTCHKCYKSHLKSWVVDEWLWNDFCSMNEE